MAQSTLATLPAGLLIRQAGAACFKRLVITSPALVQVRAGSKRVRVRGAAMHLAAGDVGLLPDHQPMTMENVPAAAQAYEARILPIPRALFEQAYVGLEDLARPPVAVPLKAASLPGEAVALFESCSNPEYLAALPAPVAALRLRELITWCALGGVLLGRPADPRLQDRLRLLFEADAARAWTLAEVALRCHMSEATLRRRLAAERTHFSGILSDVRMTRALGLLQATELPIAHIAQEVGYDSPSKFSARFKERFALSPRDLRGDPALLERIGAENARIGAEILVP